MEPHPFFVTKLVNENGCIFLHLDAIVHRTGTLLVTIIGTMCFIRDSVEPFTVCFRRLYVVSRDLINERDYHLSGMVERGWRRGDEVWREGRRGG